MALNENLLLAKILGRQYKGMAQNQKELSHTVDSFWGKLGLKNLSKMLNASLKSSVVSP